MLTSLRSNGISASDISLTEFQGMLLSEINTEIETAALLQKDDVSRTEFSQLKTERRFLREKEAPSQKVWDRIIQHGWQAAATRSKSSTTQRRNLREEPVSQNGPITFPYIVCSHSSRNKSAFQRLAPMLKYTGAHLDDSKVVLNDSQKTCYHVSLEHEQARSVKDKSARSDSADSEEYYTIAPLTDLMKIQVNTLNTVLDDSWAVPSTLAPNGWERTIRVDFSLGHRINQNSDEVISNAMNILNDIRSMTRSGGEKTRRRLEEGKRTAFENSPRIVTLSDMFSMTAAPEPRKQRRNLRESSNIHTHEVSSQGSRWSRTLELGLEADHSCQTMFDTLDVTAHQGNQGFDIVLNTSASPNDDQNGPAGLSTIDHRSDGIESSNEENDGIESMNEENDGIELIEQENDGIESSASNKHCVASLIIALSTHPLVLSVESEQPIVSTGHKSQWITQSGTPDQRPLTDIGIDGKDQIISIIDSGVDINHKYFGPTDPKVFDVSPRKQEIFHFFPSITHRF